MINVDQYRQRIIQHLKSGDVSQQVWVEIAEHLSAESECAPLLLDVEIGLAEECSCGFIRWSDEECDHCSLAVEASL